MPRVAVGVALTAVCFHAEWGWAQERPNVALSAAGTSVTSPWHVASDTTAGRPRTFMLVSYTTTALGAELDDAQLVVRCRGGKLDAFVFLGWPVLAEQDTIAKLGLQWNEAGVDSSFWRTSPDRRAVFAIAPASFVEQGLNLYGRLQLRVPRELPQAAVTYDFDVAGLRDHLPRLKRECPGELWPGSGALVSVKPEGDPPHYFEFQVDRPVGIVSRYGSLSYPEDLRSKNVEGQVLAQFVVDETGDVDMRTFRVLRSTHPEFTEAVRRYVSGVRYVPAELKGRRVRQLVQQPFNFTLTY